MDMDFGGGFDMGGGDFDMGGGDFEAGGFDASDGLDAGGDFELVDSSFDAADTSFDIPNGFSDGEIDNDVFDADVSSGMLDVGELDGGVIADSVPDFSSDVSPSDTDAGLSDEDLGQTDAINPTDLDIGGVSAQEGTSLGDIQSGFGDSDLGTDGALGADDASPDAGIGSDLLGDNGTDVFGAELNDAENAGDVNLGTFDIGERDMDINPSGDDQMDIFDANSDGAEETRNSGLGANDQGQPGMEVDLAGDGNVNQASDADSSSSGTKGTDIFSADLNGNKNAGESNFGVTSVSEQGTEIDLNGDGDANQDAGTNSNLTKGDGTDILDIDLNGDENAGGSTLGAIGGGQQGTVTNLDGDATQDAGIDDGALQTDQDDIDKTAKLVYAGQDANSPGFSLDENKTREYRIGSPHEDFEVYKGILEAEKRHEVGLSAQTAYSLPEALSTLADANQTNDSTYIQEANNYFYDKHGHAPYTDAYPASQEAPANGSGTSDGSTLPGGGNNPLGGDGSANQDEEGLQYTLPIVTDPPLPAAVPVVASDESTQSLDDDSISDEQLALSVDNEPQTSNTIADDLEDEIIVDHELEEMDLLFLVDDSDQGNESVIEIDNWEELFPDIPKPDGPIKIKPLEGEEYENVRKEANTANRKIHEEHPEYDGMEIHEIIPVKQGGSPTDPENKVALTPERHDEVHRILSKIFQNKK